MNSIGRGVSMRRLAGLALIVSLFLSACVAPVEVPTAQETATAPAAASTTECEAGFRLFDHELLATDPVCIPENPQTIVPLDIASLEMTLLAGKTPLATGAWMLEEMPLLVPVFAEPLAAVEGLGWPAELEKIATLAPDLILSPPDAVDTALASEIAPVVVADPIIYSNWKLGMEFWAAALNMEDRYTEMAANYDQRIAELHAALGDRASDEVSIVSVTSDGPMLWMPDSAPGAVVADTGLQRPEAQRYTGEDAVAKYGDMQWIQISPELIDLVDGDDLFFFTYASTDPEASAQVDKDVTDFELTPIWQSLDAVEAGQAYRVGPHWWRAQTYYLASKVIDDLFTNLTDTQATTPVLAIEQ